MTDQPSRRGRGRPPHPDILTPREWQVLDLLRRGLTNEQIAQRLDISFATAKYHVAEIISKLGVQTREQAAAWQPEAAVVRWWQRAMGPLTAAMRRLGPLTLAKAGVIAGALSALVALAVLVWAAEDGEEPATVAQPSLSPKATKRPTVAPPSPSPSTTTTPPPPHDLSGLFENLPQPTEEMPVAASVPPGTRLVSGVYRIGVDGTNLFRLVGPTDPDRDAHLAFAQSLSPDGRWLAFTSGQSDARGRRQDEFIYIYLRDLAESSSAIPVVKFASVTQIAVSADGRKLLVGAYLHPVPDFTYACEHHYLVDLDARSVERLTMLDGVCDPQWSPVGDLIAYKSDFGIEVGPSIVNVVNLNGEHILQREVPFGSLAWSPDGSSLALYDRGGIRMISLDGSLRQITQTDTEGPIAWSPGGDRIASTVYESAERERYIQIVNVASGSIETFGRGDRPVWSRDGRRIAYLSHDDLFVTDPVSGTSVQVIQPAQPLIGGASWPLGDGSIIFGYGGGYSVRTVRPDGTGEKHLAYGRDPIWSPDGDRIAFDGSGPGLSVVSPDGDGLLGARPAPARITAFGDYAGAACRAPKPRWSDDGTQIIRFYAGGVYMLPPDGSAPPLLIEEGCPKHTSPAGGVHLEDQGYFTDGSASPVHVIGVVDETGNTVFHTEGRDPEWGPDGPRFAYWHEEAVYVADYTTGEIVRLGDAPPVSDFSLGTISWSPDGSKVAYALGRRFADRVIYLANPEVANSATVLAKGGEVAWSPNDRFIAFTGGDRLYRLELYVVAAQSGAIPVKVAEGGAPSWSPDGTHILFTR